jgi:hypothetical protein
VILVAAGGGLVFDHQLHFKSGMPEFKPWADTVLSFSYSKTVPYFQVRAFLSRQGIPSVIYVSNAASTFGSRCNKAEHFPPEYGFTCLTAA